APDLGRTIDRPCIVGTRCALDPRLRDADVNLVTTGPADTKDARAGLGAPATTRATGFLPHDDDAQFIPDRAGLYRFKRDGLTQFIAVNASAARAGAIAPPPDVAPTARSGLAD